MTGEGAGARLEKDEGREGVGGSEEGRNGKGTEKGDTESEDEMKGGETSHRPKIFFGKKNKKNQQKNWQKTGGKLAKKLVKN